MYSDDSPALDELIGELQRLAAVAMCHDLPMLAISIEDLADQFALVKADLSGPLS